MIQRRFLISLGSGGCSTSVRVRSSCIENASLRKSTELRSEGRNTIFDVFGVFPVLVGL